MDAASQHPDCVSGRITATLYGPDSVPGGGDVLYTLPGHTALMVDGLPSTMQKRDFMNCLEVCTPVSTPTTTRLQLPTPSVPEPPPHLPGSSRSHVQTEVRAVKAEASGDWSGALGGKRCRRTRSKRAKGQARKGKLGRKGKCGRRHSRGRKGSRGRPGRTRRAPRPMCKPAPKRSFARRAPLFEVTPEVSFVRGGRVDATEGRAYISCRSCDDREWIHDALQGLSVWGCKVEVIPMERFGTALGGDCPLHITEFDLEDDVPACSESLEDDEEWGSHLEDEAAEANFLRRSCGGELHDDGSGAIADQLCDSADRLPWLSTGSEGSVEDDGEGDKHEEGSERQSADMEQGFVEAVSDQVLPAMALLKFHAKEQPSCGLGKGCAESNLHTPADELSPRIYADEETRCDTPRVGDGVRGGRFGDEERPESPTRLIQAGPLKPACRRAAVRY